MSEHDANNTSHSSATPKYGFTARYLVAPFAYAICYSISNMMDSDGLGILAFLLFFVAWLPFTLWRIVAAMWRRLWKKGLSLVAAVICAWPIVRVTSTAEEYIHLALTYYRHTDAIAASMASGAPLRFPWRSTGFAGIACSDTTLIYDPKGYLSKEVEETQRINPKPIIVYRHLIGSYYTLFEACRRFLLSDAADPLFFLLTWRC